MQRLGRLAGEFVIEIDVRDVKRNVLFSVPAERLLQLFGTHLRQHYVLDDDRMAADSCGDAVGANLMFTEDVGDDVGDVVELHDLPVDDRVGLKVFEAQVEKLKARSSFAEFNCLDGTGTDVQTNEVLFTGAFF